MHVFLAVFRWGNFEMSAQEPFSLARDKVLNQLRSILFGSFKKSMFARRTRAA